MYKQADNKRNNINFTYNGETHSPKWWCRYFNVNYKTCMTRYYRGKPLDECLGVVSLTDKRRNKYTHNSKLYLYYGAVYSISKLSEVINIPKWKLYETLKKRLFT